MWFNILKSLVLIGRGWRSGEGSVTHPHVNKCMLSAPHCGERNRRHGSFTSDVIFKKVNFIAVSLFCNFVAFGINLFMLLGDPWLIPCRNLTGDARM